MATLERDLIRKINRGSSFILLGAGASVDSGYPSWSGLADTAIEMIANRALANQEKCDALVVKRQTGDLIGTFEDISTQLGRKETIDLMSEIFNSITPRDGEVYKHVCSWPFRVYLTTNYDNRIKTKLQEAGHVFLEKKNGLADFRSLRVDADKLIFKIHGDFEDPNSVVLTQADYDKIRNAPEFQYWRDKIYSVLHMCNLVIIGYSAKDPNFQDQLERAKRLADPDNPVYMFAADLTPTEVSKLFIENNIHVILYDNRDGNHKGLRKTLRRYSSFICKRDSGLVGAPEVDHAEAEVAASVYFYNEVVLRDTSVIAKALYNVILNHLINSPIGLDKETLIQRLGATGVIHDETAVLEALDGLLGKRLIVADAGTGLFETTDSGTSLVESARARTADVREKFLLYCEHFILSNGFGSLDSSKIVSQLLNALTGAFKKRGIEIARYVHNGDEVPLYSSTDLVEEIEKYATVLTSEEFEAFTDLFLEILQVPSIEAREFLGLLCNGYFSYHILGHEQRGRDLRLQELKSKNLIVDSSILIPLLAKDSVSHTYAAELIAALKENGISMTITERLL